MNHAELLLRAVKEEVTAYKRAVNGLYEQHGESRVPKYDEERMEEIERSFRAERNGRLRGIERQAQALHDKFQRETEVAGEFAPDSVLSASERSAAAERLPLIEADFASMNDRQLTERLSGILATGSKVERLCYRQAAGKRARGEGEGGKRVVPYAHLLDQLDAALVGQERVRRVAEANRRLKEARAVLDACYLGRHGAGSLMQLHSSRYHRPQPRPPAGVPSGGGEIAS